MSSARFVSERLEEARSLARWYADGGELWLACQWQLVADELVQRVQDDSPTKCRGEFASFSGVCF